jgi:hypothetical protein
MSVRFDDSGPSVLTTSKLTSTSSTLNSLPSGKGRESRAQRGDVRGRRWIVTRRNEEVEVTFLSIVKTHHSGVNSNHVKLNHIVSLRDHIHPKVLQPGKCMWLAMNVCCRRQAQGPAHRRRHRGDTQTHSINERQGGRERAHARAAADKSHPGAKSHSRTPTPTHAHRASPPASQHRSYRQWRQRPTLTFAKLERENESSIPG